MTKYAAYYDKWIQGWVRVIVLHTEGDYATVTTACPGGRFLRIPISELQFC